MNFFRPCLLLVAITILSLGISCEDVNNFDPNRDRLEGMIGGEEWSYGSGNARYNAGFTTDVEGLLLIDDLDEPCSVVTTLKDHISLKFPPGRGTFNLPGIINSNNTADVVFHLDEGATRYTATGGFLEVVEVTSTEIVGFISADYDDDNYVEGSFILRVCN